MKMIPELIESGKDVSNHEKSILNVFTRNPFFFVGDWRCWMMEGQSQIEKTREKELPLWIRFPSKEQMANHAQQNLSSAISNMRDPTIHGQGGQSMQSPPKCVYGIIWVWQLRIGCFSPFWSDIIAQQSRRPV